MHYKVMNEKGEKIEEHFSDKACARACAILNAHEVRNGRTPCYTSVPPHGKYTIEELDLVWHHENGLL